MPTVLEEEALQGTTPKHARNMGNVQELFWCDARHEHGHLQPAPDCDERDCFVVQGKKQETNTGIKPNMPDRYRCTITCAFCCEEEALQG